MSQNVVLAHDWLTGFRGGEWILEAICQMFPEAPLYTLVYLPNRTSPIIENRKIHTSALERIPNVHGIYRKLLPIFPLAVAQMKVSEPAEVMVSTSHCVIKGLKKPPGSFHLSYVHSPMRYMYDQYEAYFGPRSGSSSLQKFGAVISRPYLTAWDRWSNQNVDCMVANSDFVRDRIRRYYKRDPVVVYPFVEFSDFSPKHRAPKSDFFLMLTAFAPNKRVDLAIQAFNELKLPLKIIGEGQEADRLKKMAGSTIEFCGPLDRAQVVEHLAKARALVFPGIEDFGITPLEALASGTPVIAIEKGGVLETLRSGDSVFFKEQTTRSLIEGVTTFMNRESKSDFQIPAHPASDPRSRLGLYTRERFQKEINGLIEQRIRC